MAWVELPDRPAERLARLEPGDHLCLVVPDDVTLLSVAAGYIADGLSSHHKILYFTDGLQPQALTAGLEYLGVEVDRALASGQLEIATADETYLAPGRFDAEETIARWTEQIAEARRRGYAGLRVAGDMGWAARQIPGTEHLARYEAQVNRVFAGGYAMALCLYDRRLFTAAELERVARGHPATSTAPVPDGWQPSLRMRYHGDPVSLRLEGEIDTANREAAIAAVGHLLESARRGDTIVVDMSGLRLIDGATAAMLAHTAMAIPQLRLKGCRPAVAGLIDMVAGSPVAAMEGAE